LPRTLLGEEVKGKKGRGGEGGRKAGERKGREVREMKEGNNTPSFNSWLCSCPALQILTSHHR